MIEVAMVFDKKGNAIFWPSVPGSAGSIPDNRNLWDRLWENRDILGGVAHTHPWDGPTSPSGTDLTTFAAIEAGLGKALIWPIVTMTHVSFWAKRGARMAIREEDNGSYVEVWQPFLHKEWEKNIEELRRLSLNRG